MLAINPKRTRILTMLIRPSKSPLPSLQRRRTRRSISLLSLSPHSLQRPLRPKPLIPLIPLISLTISPSTSSLTIPRQISRTSSPTRAFRTKPFPRSLWPLRMQKPFLFQTSLLLSPRMYLLRNPLLLLRIWMRVQIPKRKSLRRIPDIMSLLVRWSFPIRSRNSWKLPHGLTA